MKTAADFIAFFEAIPEDQWTVHEFKDEDGRCCARGHAGETPEEETEDAFNLMCLMNTHLQNGPGDTATKINDGAEPRFNQSSPRARILAALREIQSKGG